ncbi:hypothetical protein O9992_21810 [Vibrio lentus]|nr:hypothetical protein [Vibrio lentus]
MVEGTILDPGFRISLQQKDLTKRMQLGAPQELGVALPNTGQCTELLGESKWAVAR